MKNMQRFATYGKTIKPVAGTDAVVDLVADFKKTFPGLLEWASKVDWKSESGK